MPFLHFISPARPCRLHYKLAMGSVTEGMVLRFPTTADGYSIRGVKLQDPWLDVGDEMRIVAERQVFAATAHTVSLTLRDLFNNEGLFKVLVSQIHQDLLSLKNVGSSNKILYGETMQ